MSDLQDLIHRNAQLAFEQGAKTERTRILQAIEEMRPVTACRCESCLVAEKFFKLIKGEQ